MEKILASASAGGILNAMSGGDFRDGFRRAGLIAAAEVSYARLVGRSARAHAKLSRKINTTGTAVEPHIAFVKQLLDLPIGGGVNEYSDVMKWLGKNPIVGPSSGMHDVFTGTKGYGLRYATGIGAKIMSIPVVGPVYNVVMMPVAAVWTSGALISEHGMTHLILNNRNNPLSGRFSGRHRYE